MLRKEYQDDLSGTFADSKREDQTASSCVPTVIGNVGILPGIRGSGVKAVESRDSIFLIEQR